MKKILIATNILLLGIIIFLASKGKNANAQDRTPRDQLAERSMLQTDNKKEEGLIDYNVAVRMSRDYQRDLGKAKINARLVNGRIINGRLMKSDATSIWFPLSAVKEFIDRINKSIPSSKPCRPLLGIRIYYAKYPVTFKQDSCLMDLDSSITSHHTVFMVPTYRDTLTKMDVDFNMDYMEDSCKPTPYVKLPPSARKTLSILGFSPKQYELPELPLGFPVAGATQNNTSGGSIKNHGGLSPPPDGAGIFPTPHP